jgi:TatD DNase family protein
MIDAHAHLDDEAFEIDRADVAENLKKNGIDYVFNCGSNIASSKMSVELSKRYDNIYAAVGIHPLDSEEYNEENLNIIENLAKYEKVVAIGEIGLDLHYDDSPSLETQMRCFDAHLNLAEKLNLPVVIHSRDASGKTFDILKSRREKNDKFVALIHCYSGSVEMMRDYIDMGFYISLGGVTTFKNAKLPKKIAKEIPLDRLLLETDCPYMTPEPNRGKRNEPKYIKYTAENIANLRGISLEELTDATDENTKKFYRLNL